MHDSGTLPMAMPQSRPIPHANPVRGRINSAFFRLMDGYMHWKYRALKSRLFGGLPDRILELGAGTGANFRYLRPGTEVIAIEPNHHMHRNLARAASKHGIDLDIRSVGGEAIDLPDESVGAVICSLVLCTVGDPQQVLAEVRRILEPGGRFVCIEHVAAAPDTLIGRLQRWVYRPWRWFFEGCHTHRDTGSTLEQAGFRSVSIEPFTWPSIFAPVRPQISAVCIK